MRCARCRGTGEEPPPQLPSWLEEGACDDQRVVARVCHVCAGTGKPATVEQWFDACRQWIDDRIGEAVWIFIGLGSLVVIVAIPAVFFRGLLGLLWTLWFVFSLPFWAAVERPRCRPSR